MKFFIGLFFIFFLHATNAQDSLKINKPFPKRAALFSAILPGSGQVYNHIYSKKKKLQSIF